MSKSFVSPSTVTVPRARRASNPVVMRAPSLPASDSFPFAAVPFSQDSIRSPSQM